MITLRFSRQAEEDLGLLDEKRLVTQPQVVSPLKARFFRELQLLEFAEGPAVPRRGMPGARRWFVDRVLCVYYRREGDEIYVYRIRHAKQRPLKRG